MECEEESIVRGSDSSEYKTTTMLVKDDLIWFTDFASEVVNIQKL